MHDGKLAVKQAAKRFAVPEATLRRWIAKAAFAGATREVKPERRRVTG